MAGEIAVRQLTTIADELRKEQTSLGEVLQSANLPPVDLTDVFARIDWADYANIFDLIAERWGFEKLAALGAESVYNEDSLAFREGMFLEHDYLGDLLQSVGGPNGAYSLVLPCIQFALENLEPRTWLMTSTMLPGFRLCKAQHHYGSGTVRELPRLLFEKSAQVSLEFDNTTARYLITLPHANPLAHLRRRWQRSKPNPNFMHMMRDNFSQLAVRQNRLQTESSRRLQAESRLAQSEKMEALGNLTGGIAHDFNNLLSVVVGQLDMLEADLTDPEMLRRINEAIAAAQRGAALTQQLLAFGRQAQLRPVELEANASIRAIKELLSVTMDEAVSIEFTLTPDTCGILVDRNQFENALLNLAINARDAMPKGGTLNIETHCLELDAMFMEQQALAIAPGEYVVISVADNGVGITEDVLNHAFEPFFTTKKTGEGTGLGLSMVWGFLQQSGGSAQIQSEIGYGTKVVMYLPLQKLSAESEDAFAEPEHAPPLRQGIKILVVEDQGPVRDIVKEMLRSLHAIVTVAEDGQSALLALNSDIYDLLMTDIVLPGGLLGPDIAERALIQQPQLKVAFMSGNTQMATGNEFAAVNSENLIFKPFTINALRDFVERVVKD